MSHLESRWSHDGPKRLLALDGGGVRGVVSLCYLEKIEQLLRAKSGNANLVLADWFDLIGGTSTGSIIAAGLAMGMEVEELIQLYRRLAEKVFVPSFLGRISNGFLAPKFKSDALGKEVNKLFNVELGDKKVKTGLMIMTRRVDTGSPWPVNNIPSGPFYECPDGKNWLANRRFRVCDLVLASAAAPTYFEPQTLEVGVYPNGKPEIGHFVDGGVSPHNNPALQLLRLATLKGHGLGWPFGAGNLSLLSIGTGTRPRKYDADQDLLAGEFALECLMALMDDCADEVELALQWMSRSETARHLDAEVGKLEDDVLGGGSALLHYARYNLRLEHLWLKRELNEDLPDDRLESFAKMDEPGNIKELMKLARKAAAKQVHESHLS